MPLGPSGSKAKAAFTSRYGEGKGERVFYGKMQADPKFRQAMHRGVRPRKR